MAVSATVWALTVTGIIVMLVIDFVFHARPHVPTLRESAVWSAAYVAVALIFGVGVLSIGGVGPGSEYFAGYVTEKALSVDNLFVFLVIIASFKVPREDQQKVLLFGITFALIARTGFIFLGAALINQFAWTFYVFGLALILTAGNMLKSGDPRRDEVDNVIVRVARRTLPTTDRYDGNKLFTTVGGRRVMTPMPLVVVVISASDLLFALDSVPAIFGLTQNTYLVFTATAFSLLGLRQLYFLIDGLLDRLIFLSYGLGAILAFIGVRLVLHALHENTLPFVNGGEHVDVTEISTTASLGVILGVLTVTVIASLLSPWGRTRNIAAKARYYATSYLEPNYCRDPAERERVYRELEEQEVLLERLPGKYRQRADADGELRALIEDAHRRHSSRTST